jgi:hypothetical protein
VILCSVSTARARPRTAELLRKDYDDPAENPSFDFGPIISDLVKSTPNVVIAVGTNESVTKIMQQLEGSWPPALPNRPIYLFGDGGRLDELVAATTTNADLRRRVLGTAPGRKTASYDQWAVNFKGFHNGTTPLTYADTAYDSAYLLAYAIGTLGSAPSPAPASPRTEADGGRPDQGIAGQHGSEHRVFQAVCRRSDRLRRHFGSARFRRQHRGSAGGHRRLVHSAGRRWDRGVGRVLQRHAKDRARIAHFVRDRAEQPATAQNEPRN